MFYNINFSRLIIILSKALNAIRYQVIRRNPLIRVFDDVYNNQLIRFNIQDTYLESDIINNSLTWAFTYKSIRYNLNALKEVPWKVIKRLLIVDLKIIILE